MSAPAVAPSHSGNILQDELLQEFRTASGGVPIVLSGGGSPTELTYVVHDKEIRAGEHRVLGPWHVKAFAGTVRVASESGPGRNLKFEFTDTDVDNHVALGQLDLPVEPGTTYRLTGEIKTRNINWLKSHCRFEETGSSQFSDHRRIVNTPNSADFMPFSLPYTTGPRASRMNVLFHLVGVPKVEGIVRQPSLVWLRNLQLQRSGKAMPRDEIPDVFDFEDQDLQRWLVTQLGGSWQEADTDVNPRLTTEQAHSGRQSLKFTGVWGIVELPFAERLTDCIVSLQFFDGMEGRGRTRLFSLVDERGAVFPHSAGNRAVALGAYREAANHYSCFGGPRMPCPYCSRDFGAGSKGAETSPTTSIGRSREWHELTWDVSKGEGIVFYMDGREVGRTDAQDGFRFLQLGENYWNGFTCYVDDVRIRFKE